MLKGLDPLLGGELLQVLATMGHGDQLALVDRNFPAASLGQRVVRLEGTDIERAGSAILSVLPLDTFVDAPLIRMEPVERGGELLPVQVAFIRLAESIERRPLGVVSLPRQAFYASARAAYAIVATGELRPYACFILIKGVVFETNTSDGKPLVNTEQADVASLGRAPEREFTR